MKKATITLSDELEELVEAYQRDQELPTPLSGLTEVALRQYLRLRGYLPTSEYRRPRMTPLDEDSGASDISIEHDRYLYDDPV